VTISEEARGDLSRALPLDAQRITVVPPGSVRLSSVAGSARGSRGAAQLFERHGITRPFILALGTVQPRKDLGTVVRAFLRMRERTGSTHQLVIAGRPGWGDGSLERPRHEADRRAIVTTGALTDREVAALFASASLALNASLYEGFGLAVLEALANGVPLISTAVPALSGAPEDSFLRVAAGDVGGLSCAIERVLTCAPLRARLIAHGHRHAARFSWDDTARATIAVYREAVEERRRP
jgi:glycosyltransferase involved in cell wall biosynthesis